MKAFVFPGQGSQYPGMGKDVHDAFPESASVFREADDVLGFFLSRLCFEGPAEKLQLTYNTQPALLTVSVAILRALEQSGHRPEIVAGHSLGEYTGLVAAGALEFSDALRLVQERGRLMQEAVPVGVGAMAAILKLDPDRVQEICEAAAGDEVVSPANINTPKQTVIAGHREAVERVCDLATKEGGRAIRLAVSAPFHCSLMEPAQTQLAPLLRQVAFNDLKVPLVNNVEGRIIQACEEAREGLIRQVSLPVRWLNSVETMWRAGYREFWEIGPGKVVSGLITHIVPEAKVLSVSTADRVRKLSEL